MPGKVPRGRGCGRVDCGGIVTFHGLRSSVFGGSAGRGSHRCLALVRCVIIHSVGFDRYQFTDRRDRYV
jgi:hypothetical protein